jgi:hypothetical protein
MPKFYGIAEVGWPTFGVIIRNAPTELILENEIFYIKIYSISFNLIGDLLKTGRKRQRNKVLKFVFWFPLRTFCRFKFHVNHVKAVCCWASRTCPVEYVATRRWLRWIIFNVNLIKWLGLSYFNLKNWKKLACLSGWVRLYNHWSKVALRVECNWFTKCFQLSK